MDLPIDLKKISIQSTAVESNGDGSKIAVEVKDVANVLPSKRIQFLSTYQQQCFSFPIDSIIYYILMNPKTPKMYQKLIQSCKFFFIKNPIIIASELIYRGENGWKFGFDMPFFKMDTFTSKFWITNFFDFFPRADTEDEIDYKDILSTLTPKFHRCDAKEVFLRNQILSFDDIHLLISSAQNIYMENVTVKNKDSLVLPVEKIVEAAVKAKSIYVTKPIITSKTMKELLQIPHFSKLAFFQMDDIPDLFDIETFYAYMKKNKTTRFYFVFDPSISETYKNRLNKIIDEIIAKKNHDYKPPIFKFVGINAQKSIKLQIRSMPR